jgi:hypothetical protein
MKSPKYPTSLKKEKEEKSLLLSCALFPNGSGFNAVVKNYNTSAVKI